MFLLLASKGTAQFIVDKSKGTHFETRKGLMDGNLVSTVYYNFGEIADWQNDAARSGVWPKGTNHTYVDGIAVIVQSETQDFQGNIFHPLETNYYEYTRHDPSNGVTYGWWPLPGYANKFQGVPAQSTEPGTWPTHWPDRPSDWDGQWNGYFGKGVQNADLEGYFVFDDNEDREYILSRNFHPDNQDSSRGGLGMQVRARGFQWSQVLAEDVIFWLYEITNMSTTDYPKTLFAQYVDWGIGGHDNSSNNAGDYNSTLNLSYAWSTVGFGSPGNWSPVGYSGYAFLESPGISDDRRDNDKDGLTDERRDNSASLFISNVQQDPFILDAQLDTAKFRLFYGYAWRPHWDADENCNWRTYTDANNNAVWDEGESLNDDVGSDGVGPFDEGYTVPDRDGTEGNGRPDQGEPNFGITDKDESDQLGLTGFLISAVHTYDLNDDERNWTALSALPQPHGQQLLGVNLANHFSSYLFHLNGRYTYSSQTGATQLTGETERFSMGMIFGFNTEDLFRRKKTVQQIYNASYRFAKPPDKPTIKAIAGDHRVTLYWDDKSEKTFDAFYQKYNFEGYRVYRSTEPNFLEDKLVTDAFGRPTFRTPIAQYDLVDGVKGLHPIDVNGADFYLGDDTGLQHSFIDSTVQNGQTYFYAVVAYDQGFTTTTVEGVFEGIPPSETTSRVKVDVNGVYETDINTAVVTPRAPAAGYVSPKLDNYTASGPGTGAVAINLLDPDSLQNNHEYRLEFEDSTAFHTNPYPYFRLFDKTSGDTLVPLTKLNAANVQTPVFHGFDVKISNDAVVDVDRNQSRWVIGSSNYIVQLGFDPRYADAYEGRRVNFPSDFDITLTDSAQGDISFPSASFNGGIIQSNIVVKNLTENIDHFRFMFLDPDDDSVLTSGDAIFFVAGDSIGKPPASYAKAKISWSVSFFKDTTIAESNQRPPQAGDVYRVVTRKPFRTGESFEFKTVSPVVDAAKAQTDLQNVAVVPNPYVGAASWEPSSTDAGRGERRIFFIHLPQQCTIRIYTISGHLVQTIEHNGTMSDGQEAWNLVSRDGMNISYGVYVYHVDAPGIGTRVDKFAVVK